MVKISSDNDFTMNQMYMKRAIELAKKGIGRTSPNPCVGAVIVKGGKIVSEAWHKKAGSDHAEIIAIKKLMKKSGIVTRHLDPSLFENAELYVTMEPCSHNGKTPSCAKAIAAAGFKKVSIGMKDPFKKVNGRGIKYLRENGIDVEICKTGSDFANEIRSLNQPFIKWASKGLPYVTLKAGMSLDGKIAASSGESKWITSEEARKDARIERSLCDAVVVGAGTVMADDPELAAHGKFKNKALLRVVVDPKLRLPLNKKVFRDENVIVFCCREEVSKKNLEKYKKAGVEVKFFSGDKISVKQSLKFLAKRGIQSVFIEGGSGVHGYMYDYFLKDRDLIDKVLFYVSPKIIGGKSALSVVGGKGVAKLKNAREFESFEVEMLGDEMKVEGIYNYW
jgi:diaminohydroxyphosphoribosylaminopyrimidine deaminase/5-amino-6-(5-phosphoribosylamino)uracil reductase